MSDTTTVTPSQQIAAEVTSWPGVEAGPGRRGEFSFRVGRREIGHLHGDHAAHFSFPKDVWRQLSEAGRIVAAPAFVTARLLGLPGTRGEQHFACAAPRGGSRDAWKTSG
jgi:Family of unknown function (DUF5519)